MDVSFLLNNKTGLAASASEQPVEVKNECQIQFDIVLPTSNNLKNNSNSKVDQEPKDDYWTNFKNMLNTRNVTPLLKKTSKHTANNSKVVKFHAPANNNHSSNKPVNPILPAAQTRNHKIKSYESDYSDNEEDDPYVEEEEEDEAYDDDDEDFLYSRPTRTTQKSAPRKIPREKTNYKKSPIASSSSSSKDDKKSRGKRVAWSPEDSKLLEEIVFNDYPDADFLPKRSVPWRVIEKKFNSKASVKRKADQCSQRFYRVIVGNRFKWTYKTSSMLRDLVNKHGEGGWANIANILTNRLQTTISDHQCRTHFKNYLRVSKKLWTERELHLLREGVDKFGHNNWDEVSKFIRKESSSYYLPLICEDTYKKL